MSKDRESSPQKKVVYLHDSEVYELQDPEIAKLLKVMRDIRTTIPVNYQLKSQLRQQFLATSNQKEQIKSSFSPQPTPSSSSVKAGMKERKTQLFQWMLFLLPCLIVIFGMFHFLSGQQLERVNNTVIREEREVFFDAWSSGDYSATTNGEGMIFFINRGSLWQIDFNGHRIQELIIPKSGQIFSWAALAPGEDKIALVVNESGKSSLVLQDIVNKEHQKTLITFEAGVKIKEITWAPEGGQLAFTKITDDKSTIYQLDLTVEGGVPVILNEGTHPTYSPDGRQLAFQRTNTNGESEIWIVNRDGKNLTLWGLGGQPSWSNENLLVFVQDRRWEKVLSFDSAGKPMLTSLQKVQEVWVSDLTGKLKVNLTQLPGPSLEEEARLLRDWERSGITEPTVWDLRSSYSDNRPQWTSDGKHVLIQRQQGSQSKLVWVKVGGLK